MCILLIEFISRTLALRELFHFKLPLPDVEVLIVMVANETQAESVLFGEAGSVAGKLTCFAF